MTPVFILMIFSALLLGTGIGIMGIALEWPLWLALLVGVVVGGINGHLFYRLGLSLARGRRQ